MTLQQAIDALNIDSARHSIFRMRDEEVFNILEKNIIQSGFMILRGSRKKRDSFYHGILSFLEDDSKSYSLIDSTLINAEKIEALFDEIRELLPKCDISKIPVDEQCWSHIYRAHNEAQDIKKSAIDSMNYPANGEYHILPKAVHYDPKNGESPVDIDAIFETIIGALTITIKMLAYENKWVKEDKITIPEQIEASLDGIFKAGSTQVFATSWRRLEEAANRIFLFGGDVKELVGDDLPDDFKQNGFTKIVDLTRGYTEDEIFDFIANQRALAKAHQNYFSLLVEEKFNLVDDLDGLLAIDDGKFIDVEEPGTLINLCETLNYDIRSDGQLYHGLTLEEWVRAYSAIKFLLRSCEESTSLPIFSHDEIANTLKKAKIDPSRINDAIKNLIFGGSSRDLFDCPLIKTANNCYAIIGSIQSSTNIYNILMSRLSSLEINFDSKGKRFEKAVNDFLIAKGYDCQSFKFKDRREEYEYDAVFPFEDKLIVIECKNRSLSMSNPIQASRFSIMIKETVEQIKRLVRGLLDNPHIVQNKFNLDIKNLTIIPVILNCLPYCRTPIDEVYVSDWSSFSKFFNSNSITASGYQNYKKEHQVIIEKLWEGESPSIAEFLEYLAMPIQLKKMSEYIKAEQRVLPINEQIALAISHLEIDENKRQQDEQSAINREEI